MQCDGWQRNRKEKAMEERPGQEEGRTRQRRRNVYLHDLQSRCMQGKPDDDVSNSSSFSAEIHLILWKATPLHLTIDDAASRRQRAAAITRQAAGVGELEGPEASNFEDGTH